MKRIIHLLAGFLCIISCLTINAFAASTLTISSPSDWHLQSWDDSLTVKWNAVDGASGYYVSIRNVTTDTLLLENKYTTSKSMSISSYLPESVCQLKIWVGAVASSSNLATEAIATDTTYIYVAHEPDISNGSASNIGETSATLSMTINKDQGYSVDDWGFYIGTSSSISNMTKYSYGYTAKGTKTANITGLSPNTKYYYRAFAENAVGEEYTGYKTFTTQSTVLDAPVITYPIDEDTYAAGQSIKLQWTAVDGVDGYRYYIKQLSGTPDRTDDDEPYVNSWENSVSSSRTYYTLSSSNVVGGYWYKFVVESYADGMDSGWSDWVYVYVEKGTLETPVITYPEANSTIYGYQDIPFVWGDVDYADEYTYFVKRLSGTPSYTDENEPSLEFWSETVSADTTHFTLDASEAIPGYWYKFVVKASAENMNPSWSEWVYCYLDELILDDPVLVEPYDQAEVTHGTSITMKWNTVPNAQGYNYKIKRLSGVPNPADDNEPSLKTWYEAVPSGATSFTLDGSNVIGGYWYKFVVEAYASGAQSKWSNYSYVYVKNGSLSKPNIVFPVNTASYDGYQSITVDWDTVSGADGYICKIKRLNDIPDRQNDNEPGQTLCEENLPAGQTEYTLSAGDFVPGSWYKFVIEAHADGMNPSWSDWVYCYADEVELEDPIISTPSSWSEVSEGTGIVVDWNSVEGAEGYRCHYKQLIGKPDTSNDNELAVNGDKIDCGTTTKYTLPASEVVGGYWYKFVVEAYSSTAASSWSNWVYVYVPEKGNLDRPVITTPKAAEDYVAGENIMFAWSRVPNATNYTYYIKQLIGEPDYSDNEPAVNTWSGTTGSSNRYFTLDGADVQENTWYKFVVKAEANGYAPNWSKYTYIHIPEREDWIHFVLSDAMTQISDEAFEGNDLLRTFDASNSNLEMIGSRAFADCTNLQAIYLPASVFIIAEDAFANCPNLTIHCISGSIAEEYALSKGIRVEAHGIAIETDTIQLSRTEWNISDSDRAEAAVSVRSSDTWTASSDKGWLTLSATSGNDGANVVLTASANTTNAVRSATVSFSCGQATAVIRVTQNASSIKECTLKLTTDYWEPTSDMMTRKIVVQHKNGFTVSSNKSWLTYSISDSEITAEVTSDALTSTDTGILTVTCKDCGAAQTVTVATKGTVVVPAPANVIAKPNEPHATVITWSAVSGASYILERSDDGGASWIQIASTSNTSYTDAANIGAAKTYYYRVTACKTISGSTVKSNSVKSGACTTPAEAVLEFRGKIGSIGDNGRARIEELTDVSWSTISGMTYKLSLKDITDSKNEYYVNGLENKNVGTTNSYSLSGLLVEGHKYRVWVGAFNSFDRCEGQTKAREFSVIKPSTEPAPTIVLNSASPVKVNNSGNSFFGISFTMTNASSVRFEFDGLQVYEKWDKETQGAKEGLKSIWEFNGGDIGPAYSYEKTTWTGWFYPVAGVQCGEYKITIKAIGEGGEVQTTCAVTVVTAPIIPTGTIPHPIIDGSNWYKRLYPSEVSIGFGETTSASTYSRIIDQFNVTYGEESETIAGWYERIKSSSYRTSTYCNYFAADVCYAMGAYFPLISVCENCGKPSGSGAFQAVKSTSNSTAGVSVSITTMTTGFKNNKLYCLCENKRSADRSASWLPVWFGNPAFYEPFGWRPIAYDEAKTKANQGYLTIGITSGHVFVVHPNSDTANTYISQSGANLMSNEKIPTSYTSYSFFYNKGIN